MENQNIKNDENISIRNLSLEEVNNNTINYINPISLTKQQQNWAKSMMFAALEKPKMEILNIDKTEEWLGCN
jgi:pectate lyase